jgi:preprotein translocase subunit SecE
VADEKKPNAITRYFRETTGELKKVSWPTWPEARQLTTIVVLVMVAMAILLGLVDLLAESLIGLAIGA